MCVVLLADALSTQEGLQSISLSKNSLNDELIGILSEGVYMSDTLGELRVTGNPLSIKGIEYLGNAVKESKSIKLLDLSYNELEDAAIVKLATILSDSQVTEWNIEGNQLTDLGANALASELASNQKLQCLDVSHNPIKENGMMAFRALLRVNQNIKQLIVHEESDQSVEAPKASPLVLPRTFRQTHKPQSVTSPQGTLRSFAIIDPPSRQQSRPASTLRLQSSPETINKPLNMVASNSSSLYSAASSTIRSVLEPLDDDELGLEKSFLLQIKKYIEYGDWNMSFCRIRFPEDEQEMEGFAYALKSNDHVQSLCITTPLEISRRGFKWISLGLMENMIVTELNLSGVGLCSNGLRYICQALLVNQDLKKLTLNDNKIGGKGALMLSQALLKNCFIEELNVSSNKIGDEGAVAFAAYLRKSPVLKVLYVGFNGISDHGVQMLADAIYSNFTLEKLGLIGNNFTQAGEKVLRKALVQSKRMDSLYVHGLVAEQEERKDKKPYKNVFRTLARKVKGLKSK